MAAQKTMRIKLNSAICGNKYDDDGRFIGNFGYGVGKEIDWPEAEAKRFIDKGLAEPVASK